MAIVETLTELSEGPDPTALLQTSRSCARLRVWDTVSFDEQTSAEMRWLSNEYRLFGDNTGRQKLISTVGLSSAMRRL